MAGTLTPPPPLPPRPRTRSSEAGSGLVRVLALAGLAIALLLAIATTIAGITALIGDSFGRDDDGFFTAQLDDLVSSGSAIRSDEVDFTGDPGPGWLLDRLDTEVRIEAEPVDPTNEVFIGIADARDLERYLDGVAHDVITDINGRRATYTSRPGVAAEPPTSQSFWAASATGAGAQTLEWELAEGEWVAVLMNADGSLGVANEVDVGVSTDVLRPIGLALLAAGLLGVLLTVPLIGATALSSRRRMDGRTSDEVVESDHAPSAHPLRLEARIDRGLSTWQWLVKWFLAIPHVLCLAVLSVGFVLATIVAFFSILFTGRYPSSIFRFTSGVLKWGWRVTFYAFSGLGTDRYPPFSLGDEPNYPATLSVAEPGDLSRVKVLFKWWLLALPHYVVLAFISGWGVSAWVADDGTTWSAGGGLLGVLALITGCFMLFTRRYPKGLFDLTMGLNRWVYRVIAYIALMTDVYPPFRLDQGGTEGGPDAPEPYGDDDFDLRATEARAPALT